MKIGTVTLENNVFLAPMAGVTDQPFRLLCKEMGCGLVYSEMVSAKGMFYESKNTGKLLEVDERERPVAVQLFGSDPQIMADMAKRLEEAPVDIIDVNMGCPVPKVVNNGEGSALMKDPKLAGKIVAALVKAVKKPVTVKIRKGFDESRVNAVEVAKILEDAGAAAIAVHGRTREQFYSGKADWEIIRRVKEAVGIPVFGNGDVDSPQRAAAMLRETGCDGIMIGRGAQGNPWIFSRVLRYLEEGEILPPPGRQEVKEMIFCHMEMLIRAKGEYTGIREMRKHVAWYTAGFPHSARLRGRINTVESPEEMRRALEEL